MDDKHRRGLCYHCEEKWHPQHKCNSHKVYPLQGCEEMVEPLMDLVEEPAEPQAPTNLPIKKPEISLNAI